LANGPSTPPNKKRKRVIEQPSTPSKAGKEKKRKLGA
jgi:hypothetical protein